MAGSKTAFEYKSDLNYPSVVDVSRSYHPRIHIHSFSRQRWFVDKPLFDQFFQTRYSIRLEHYPLPPRALTTSDTNQSTFHCVACMDTCAGSPILVAGYQTCEDCFRSGILSQFHEALRRETEYPVIVKGTILNINDYRRFFTVEFLEQWTTRMREYHTPWQLRICCHHNVPIPSSSSSQADASQVRYEFCPHLVGSATPPEVPFRVLQCPVCDDPACSR